MIGVNGARDAAQMQASSVQQMSLSHTSLQVTATLIMLSSTTNTGCKYPRKVSSAGEKLHLC